MAAAAMVILGDGPALRSYPSLEAWRLVQRARSAARGSYLSRFLVFCCKASIVLTLALRVWKTCGGAQSRPKRALVNPRRQEGKKAWVALISKK
jgi:hypothetical protein